MQIMKGTASAVTHVALVAVVAVGFNRPSFRPSIHPSVGSARRLMNARLRLATVVAASTLRPNRQT
jgi:hypothetical protein